MSTTTWNRTGGQHRVLLVGPDSAHLEYLRRLLEVKGFRIIRARAIPEACQKIVIVAPHLVLADLGEERQAAGSALLPLVECAQGQPAPPAVVIVSDQQGQDSGTESLKQAGASFLSKPVQPSELLATLSLAFAAYDAALLEPEQQKAVARPDLPPDFILGRSPAIQRVIEQIRLVAPKDTSVLITGETGTGKERVSRAIHFLSGRRKSPMVSVNCGGIPASLLEDEFFGHVKGAFTDAHQARMGRFEQANRSTIFLDEIGDLPLELQPKLLRVLQEREIHRVGGVEAIKLDVRVVAATNVDLWALVQEGRFREDLFYRINVFPIHLPPLRQRREDIPLFVSHFLEKFARRDKLPPKRLRPEAEAELMRRPWPGNVRELENAVEIAVIRSQDREEVDVSDFPPARPLLQSDFPAAAPEGDFKSLVRQFEKDLILRVLERTKGNKSQAAQILRLKRTTLLEKLKKLQDPAESSSQ
ncbi:MAG TPA: sigma-54 dependent transcriptional regulator [Bryobacterales bacterium]|nr:sigma-54 dependent transcriptional regulator [Bryobacterales bacterium]